jgi:hypothetical protein
VWQTDWRRSDSVKRMSESQPALFRGRHFRSESIVLCVRWYLRYPPSYGDLEEMMAERGCPSITPQLRAGFCIMRRF